MRAGDTLADDGIGRPAIGFGGGNQFVQFVTEAHLLAERGNSAFKRQQAHRNAPAIAGCADQAVFGAAGIGKKRLVEFGIAIDLADRPDFDAGLVQRHHQKRQAFWSGRAFGCARYDEDPVRNVGKTGPDLLAIDHPFAIFDNAFGADAGKV